MKNKSETLAAIYGICFPETSGGSLQFEGDVSNSAPLDDKTKCSEILSLLRENVTKKAIIFPKNTEQTRHWSFVTSLNNARATHNDSTESLNLKTVMSDGYRLYNQYMDNKNTSQYINNFHRLTKFNNYVSTIPKEKYIKTKNGFEYNIDDLVTMIIKNNSHLEPYDIDSKTYLWDSPNEENSILGHPGLSEELRSTYLDRKYAKESNQKQMCAIFEQNPDILDIIGKFGILFLNVNIGQEHSELFSDKLQTSLATFGSVIQDYHLFPNKSVSDIIITPMADNNFKESGYYLVLLYLKLHNLCRTAGCPNVPDVLPFFKMYTDNQCTTTVYCGTLSIPLIDIKNNVSEIDFSTIANIRHKIFIYIPDLENDKLIITTHTINSDIREDFVESGIDLNQLCPSLIEEINKEGAFFNNAALSKQYTDLYNQIQSNLH